MCALFDNIAPVLPFLKRGSSLMVQHLALFFCHAQQSTLLVCVLLGGNEDCQI